MVAKLKRRIEVYDLMQKGYVYWLTAPIGETFDAGFAPQLTPKQMLELGVFGGKHMTDCAGEFPDHWFDNALPSRRSFLPPQTATGVATLGVRREKDLRADRRSHSPRVKYDGAVSQ